MDVRNSDWLYKLHHWHYGSDSWLRIKLGKDGCMFWKLGAVVALLLYPATILWRFACTIVSAVTLAGLPKEPRKLFTTPYEKFEYRALSMNIGGIKLNPCFIWVPLILTISNIGVFIRNDAKAINMILAIDILMALLAIFVIPLIYYDARSSRGNELKPWERTDEYYDDKNREWKKKSSADYYNDNGWLEQALDWIAYGWLIFLRVIGSIGILLLLGYPEKPREILTAEYKRYHYRLLEILDIPLIWCVLGIGVAALYIASFIFGIGGPKLREILTGIAVVCGAIIAICAVVIGIIAAGAKATEIFNNRRATKAAAANPLDNFLREPGALARFGKHISEIYRSIKDKYCPKLNYVDPERD
jgi:hypothetical protein